MNRTSLVIALTILCAAPGLAMAAPVVTVSDGFVFATGGDMIGPYHPFPGDEDPDFKRLRLL